MASAILRCHRFELVSAQGDIANVPDPVWHFERLVVQPEPACCQGLLGWLMHRDQIEARCIASEGYDRRPFPSMAGPPRLGNAQPPKGRVYDHILRSHHKPTAKIPAYPAPPDISARIYNQDAPSAMLSKLQSGRPVPVIAWAKAGLEGFVR